MTRAAAIVAGLSAGHAALALLFWALIHVPESTVWMLGLSLALVIALVLLAGWIQASAALAWTPGLPLRTLARQAPRGVPAFLVALVVYAAVWWTLDRADAALETRRGEIDGWFIAGFGWTETTWVHRTIDAAVLVVRYVLAVSLGLALVAAGARDGWRALTNTRWIRRAFSRTQIGTVGLAFVVFVALPLQALDWRPDGLSPAGGELAFVMAKLTIIFALANVGWALGLWAATRERFSASAR